MRENIRVGLEQMKQINRQHLHPGEPQARRMSCGGKNRFGYNAQAGVDDKAGIIVAEQVVNQENDTGLLVPMIEEAQQNCGSNQAVAVADSSYGAGADIARAAGLHEERRGEIVERVFAHIKQQKAFAAGRCAGWKQSTRNGH